MNGEVFSQLKICTQKIAEGTRSSLKEVRDICIRTLDSWDEVDESLHPIWTDILDAVGFYPYIEKQDLRLTSISDEIRKESYRSDNINGMVYHSEQKKILKYLLEGRSVIVSAPTSFGKSILIEELVAANQYRNIVIVQPTLALLDETRMRLKKYADHYKIIVRTTQKPSLTKGNILLLTAERIMEYSYWPNIDFLVIDEFYKLSLRRKDPRAATLNNAFLYIIGKYNCPFYMLGPNIEGVTPGFAEKYNAAFIRTDYALVNCDVIDKSDGIAEAPKKKRDEIKLERLINVLDAVDGEQTIVYCSSPSRARKFARSYYDKTAITFSANQHDIPLCEWIRENISSEWSLAEEIDHGIAFHDGSLPRHIGSSIIRYFNLGVVRYLFCTTTIIEGVNTSAKNVVLLDNTKGSEPIDFFDYSNIKGRSGRFMEHYIGRIYNIAPVPTEQETVIDIPLYGQDPIVDEILINIPQEEVIAANKARKKKLEDIPTELKSIVKKNGVSIEAQLRMLSAIKKDIDDGYTGFYNWSGTPSFDQLVHLMKIAGNIGELISFNYKSGVLSEKQLAYYLCLYGRNHSIRSLINDIYNSIIKGRKDSDIENNRQMYFDKAIERAFHIYRHLFQFTVPKAISVIDSLQRYALGSLGLAAGSYTFYIQQLENDYIDERLTSFVEYGLPPNCAEKLVRFIGSLDKESDIIHLIYSNFDMITADWKPYEIEQLKRCL